MRGSLAIWCERDGPEVDDHEPQLELHFNIWRDLPKGPDALDIGIFFKNPRTVNRAFIYLPGKVTFEQLEDLSSILEDQTTLSAVFNDTLSVGKTSVDGFEVRRNDKVAFHIVPVDFKSAAKVTIEYVEEDDFCNGTIIALEADLVRLMRQIGDHYVRFRIKLSGELANLLVRDNVPIDRAFLSSFYKTEMIEFRVNERRNFGRVLKKRWEEGAKTTISTIHYFLVRNLSVEMAQSHTPFRKMRRLEPGLWDKYLNHLGGAKPDEMIIYHWRGTADKNPDEIEDFIALAIFRKVRAHIPTYVVMIALLGAIGSGLQALLSTIVGLLIPSCVPTAATAIVTQFVTFLILALILFVAYRWASGGNLKLGLGCKKKSTGNLGRH